MCDALIHCHYSQVHSELDRVSSKDQIYLFKNYSYSVGPCAKKSLKKQRYVNMKV